MAVTQDATGSHCGTSTPGTYVVGSNCTLVSDDRSIFTLQYEHGLASVGGMVLLNAMVAFMIIVDRLQFWTDEAVKEDLGM